MHSAIAPILLLAAAGIAVGAEAPETFEVSGYFQVRYVDQRDIGRDGWELTQLRLKQTTNFDADTKLVLQGELSDRTEGLVFHWIDAFVQRRLEGGYFTRVGLSRVPFGFDNTQGTPARLPLDSPQVISRILPGKRDRGAFLYFSPPRYSKRFREMEKVDLAIPDSGVAALGWYAGAGRDNEPAGGGHFVARAAYPFTFGDKQIGQAGVSVFDGKYATRNSSGDRVRIEDHAFGAHLFVAPRPWGMQGEWVEGTMPGLDAGGETIARSFDGWYLQTMYRASRRGTLYARTERFDGFNKSAHGQPKRNDFERQSFGYRHHLDDQTDVTVEYENIKRNGADEDRLSGQLMVQF